MNSYYDMCVDLETLEQICSTLQTVGSELSEATKKMVDALQVSQDFLSGNQFERARTITLRTIENTTITAQNITNVIIYLKQLSEFVRQYSTCKYDSGD